MASSVLFFFFSSRIRHTSWTGAWSSDVCSSDLAVFADADCAAAGRAVFQRHPAIRRGSGTVRSEENEVAKECRSRWAPDHENDRQTSHESPCVALIEIPQI